MTRLLPAAYVAAVGIVALARATLGVPTISAIALTPDRLAAGRVWLFATSALVVNGAVLPQLAALAAGVVVALRRLGAPAVVLIAVVCHVGATLLAYGVLQLATGDPDGSRNPGFDYGTSAVWLGLLGALWVYYAPRRLPLVLGLAAAAASIAAFPLLAATEHGFAFALGAAGGLIARRRPVRRPARSAASTASEPAASA